MVLVYIGIEMRNFYLNSPLIRTKSKQNSIILETPKQSPKTNTPDNFLKKKT